MSAVGGSIAQRVAERIGGAQRSGNQFKVRCVAHEDKNPSLSLRDGEDGRLLAFCHAGCRWPDIERKLTEGYQFSRPELLGPDRTGEVGIYPYRVGGAVVRQKVRQAGKVFRWEQPDGNGWKSGAGDGPSVIYRFPEVVGSDPAMPVFVAEGERDCEVLRRHGHVATSAPNGAGTWKPEYATAFRGRDVWIVPDNDPPGEKHGREVGDSLVGIARSVKWLKLPLKDVREFFEAAGEKASEAFAELAENAPEFIPSAVCLLEPIPKTETETESRGLGFSSLTALWDLPPEEHPFLVDGLLKSSGSSILAATPKAGKSTLLRCSGLCVAQGERYLWRDVRQGAFLYVAIEDDIRDIIGHFKRLGATPDDPIHIISGTVRHKPEDALKRLADDIAKYDAKFVGIDPLQKFLRIRDCNDYSAVTDAMEPLHQLARDSGCHIQVVHHFNKNGGVLGSIGFDAAVDTVIEMTVDKETPEDGGPKKRYLRAETLRKGTPIPLTELEFDPVADRLTLGTAVHIAERENVERRILEYIAANGRTDHQDVLDNVTGDKSSKIRALQKLSLPPSPRLARSGGGKKGNPYYYEVT